VGSNHTVMLRLRRREEPDLSLHIFSDLKVRKFLPVVIPSLTTVIFGESDLIRFCD
jgi:hypothetical protein